MSRLLSLLAGAHLAGQRCRRRLVLAATVAVIATLGLTMLAVGGFLRLAEVMPAPTAAMVMGGAVLAVAGLIALIGCLLVRRPAAPSRSANDRPADLLLAAVTAIGRDATRHAPQLALLALVAGTAIGASPRLRKALADLAVQQI